MRRGEVMIAKERRGKSRGAEREERRDREEKKGEDWKRKDGTCT